MRLIDADRIIKRMRTWREAVEKAYGCNDDYVQGYGAALDFVENAPTVEKQEGKRETTERRNITVNELFEHFSFNFDAVAYYDETANVGGTARWNGGTDYDEFLAEYGEHNVISWSYTAFENILYLTIKGGEKDESLYLRHGQKVRRDIRRSSLGIQR